MRVTLILAMLLMPALVLAQEDSSEPQPNLIKVYNIHDLVRAAPSFDAPQFAPHSRAERSAQSGPFSESAEDESEEASATALETANDLVALIQSHIGRPDQWINLQSTAKIVGDASLVIDTTAANHEEIENLLAQLRPARPAVLAIQARVVRVRVDELDRINRELAGGDLTLDAQQADELETMGAQEEQPFEVLAVARTLALADQRVYVLHFHPHQWVPPEPPAAERPAFDEEDEAAAPETPEQPRFPSTVYEGFVLDVQPAMLDDEQVQVTLRADLNTASGVVGNPSLFQWRSTPRFPEGGGVLLSAGPTDDDAELDTELVLFLRATRVE